MNSLKNLLARAMQMNPEDMTDEQVSEVNTSVVPELAVADVERNNNGTIKTPKVVRDDNNVVLNAHAVSDENDVIQLGKPNNAVVETSKPVQDYFGMTCRVIQTAIVADKLTVASRAAMRTNMAKLYTFTTNETRKTLANSGDMTTLRAAIAATNTQHRNAYVAAVPDLTDSSNAIAKSFTSMSSVMGTLAAFGIPLHLSDPIGGTGLAVFTDTGVEIPLYDTRGQIHSNMSAIRKVLPYFDKKTGKVADVDKLKAHLVTMARVANKAPKDSPDATTIIAAQKATLLRTLRFIKAKLTTTEISIEECYPTAEESATEWLSRITGVSVGAVYDEDDNEDETIPDGNQRAIAFKDAGKAVTIGDNGADVVVRAGPSYSRTDNAIAMFLHTWSENGAVIEDSSREEVCAILMALCDNIKAEDKGTNVALLNAVMTGAA